MAYHVISEKYFSGWGSHTGAYHVGTWNCDGPPEQAAPVSLVSQVISIYVQKFREAGEDLMYIKVEADWESWYKTKYRITTYSPAAYSGIGLNVGAIQLLLGLLAAALVVIGLIYLTVVWHDDVKETIDKTISLMHFAVGGTVVLGSLWLLFSGKKKGA